MEINIGSSAIPSCVLCNHNSETVQYNGNVCHSAVILGVYIRRKTFNNKFALNPPNHPVKVTTVSSVYKNKAAIRPPAANTPGTLSAAPASGLLDSGVASPVLVGPPSAPLPVPAVVVAEGSESMSPGLTAGKSVFRHIAGSLAA